VTANGVCCESAASEPALPAPSPLVGEGWGGGWCSEATASPPAHHLATPTPNPSPQGGRELRIASVAVVLDPAGALYWPEEGALVVSDLHLEKGSSFAARGVLLPPYDTAATLARLARLITRYAPRLVIALGDSFHDGGGPARLAETDRATLAALQRGRDWLWVAGNHDPAPTHGVGGSGAAMLALGALVFRHEPTAEAHEGEIAGHLHPMACIAVRGRAIRRRCFASDARRLVMPAFGAYAGGLNVRHRAFAALFAATFTAHLLGERRLYAFSGLRCLSD
jgi:DNA ligase-associated metallophosphoesterase